MTWVGWTLLWLALLAALLIVVQILGDIGKWPPGDKGVHRAKRFSKPKSHPGPLHNPALVEPTAELPSRLRHIPQQRSPEAEESDPPEWPEVYPR